MPRVRGAFGQEVTVDVIEAIHSRRSIRDFTPEPVPRALIGELIWDAAQAPPPFAGQVPWAFTVVEGAERIAAYGDRAKRYAREHGPEGGGGAWTGREEFKVFWNAPALVVICGPVEDCCRAGQLLVLSAHARGLGACWVGAPMPWLRTPEAKAELAIPAGSTPVTAICLGYAASRPEPRQRARPAVVWSEP
jgi:nitroreductase